MAAAQPRANDPVKPPPLWLLCRTGERCFAFTVRHVAETMRMLPIDLISGAPASVLGVCIIRGEPVVVVDSARLFNDVAMRCNRLVTLRTGKRIVALAAEKIIGVQSLPADRHITLAPLLQRVETIESITMLDRELVYVLRTARIVPDDLLVSVANGDRL